MKSQRNSKGLSKSTGLGRHHGASPTVAADARPASLSASGESVATAYEIGPFRLDPVAAVLTRLGITEALGPRAVALLAF